MLELFQITNDVRIAKACAEMGGIRLWIDWEVNGKAARQAGTSSFISTHTAEDLRLVRAAAPNTPLMVRVNPLCDTTLSEVELAIEGGADRLMLPMFRSADELASFAQLVAGRLPITALLEHVDATLDVDQWLRVGGIDEVHIGLNDLHLSLGHAFMYQPLSMGLVDRLMSRVKATGKRCGFGGIARMEEGEVPGKDVLAEHLRLGSDAVILSRTFHRFDHDAFDVATFVDELGLLRSHERVLSQRSVLQQEADRVLVWQKIESIAASKSKESK